MPKIYSESKPPPLGNRTLVIGHWLPFFRGAELRPPPPGASKDPLVRYLDVHENDPPDDARLARWIRQAAALPGWGQN